jgi:hypothetical protein
MLAFSSAEITNLSSSMVALPSPGIEIEQATSLFGEMGITRKDPTVVIPGPDRVLVQPSPDGAATD